LKVNIHRQSIGLALLLSAVGLCHAEEPPATWPQWRGPTRDGRVSPGKWPDVISGEALRKSWRLDDLGPSYSGPIVADDRVFTTETVNKKIERVRCLDRRTGKEIWRKEWAGTLTVPFFAARNGAWIRATPACDGKSVYVAGIQDVLVCLDAKDGTERWRFDFVAEFKTPVPAFGFVCSPLVDEKTVIVQAGAAVVRLDKKTGKKLWKTLDDGGGMFGSAFSSPIFATIAGREQLLVQTRQKLAGVDLDKGEVLWSKPIPADRGMNILTPMVMGDSIFTSSYGGGSRAIAVTRSSDGKWESNESWAIKYQGYMTSPIIHEGHAYFLGRDRRFICLELKTGKEMWQSEKRFGEYCSLVANNDRILALDMNGQLILLQANPKEFTLLDQTEVAKAETWAHLAVCGSELYIRDLNGLTALHWKGK